jgi:hypothetical protein
MAIEASVILGRHTELYDDEFRALNRERPLSVDLDTLRASRTADESRAINMATGPCVVLRRLGDVQSPVASCITSSRTSGARRLPW